MINTGSFPTVGDSVLSYVGKGSCSKPQRGRLEAKNEMGRGSSPTGVKKNRSNVKIQEHQGPRCHVVAKLYQSNAAEASAVTRNVHVISSATGVSDFWKKRQFGTVY